jgi:hypothetical protein
MSAKAKKIIMFNRKALALHNRFQAVNKAWARGDRAKVNDIAKEDLPDQARHFWREYSSEIKIYMQQRALSVVSDLEALDVFGWPGECSRFINGFYLNRPGELHPMRHGEGFELNHWGILAQHALKQEDYDKATIFMDALYKCFSRWIVKVDLLQRKFQLELHGEPPTGLIKELDPLVRFPSLFTYGVLIGRQVLPDDQIGPEGTILHVAGVEGLRKTTLSSSPYPLEAVNRGRLALPLLSVLRIGENFMGYGVIKRGATVFHENRIEVNNPEAYSKLFPGFDGDVSSFDPFPVIKTAEHGTVSQVIPALFPHTEFRLYAHTKDIEPI